MAPRASGCEGQGRHTCASPTSPTESLARLPNPPKTRSLRKDFGATGKPKGPTKISLHLSSPATWKKMCVWFFEMRRGGR
jgi:hypothetical protein